MLYKYLQGNNINEGRELIHSLRRWQDREPEVKEEKLRLWMKNALCSEQPQAGHLASHGPQGSSDAAGGTVARSSPQTCSSHIAICWQVKESSGFPTPGRAEARCELEGWCVCCGKKLCCLPLKQECLLFHGEAASAQGSTFPLGCTSWLNDSFAEWSLLRELTGWVLATQGTSPLRLGQMAGGRLQ